MTMLLHLLHLVGVAFLTRLFPGVHEVMVPVLRQGQPSIPSVFPKRPRGQKVLRDHVEPHNPHSQQDYAEHLRRHVENAAHGCVSETELSFPVPSLAKESQRGSSRRFPSIAQSFSFFVHQGSSAETIDQRAVDSSLAG
jgi:hypothetical protein